MAVSNIQEREFVGGSFNGEEFSYEVVYQCDCDNKDGPDIVRRNPFFRIGKSYSFGNDRNPAAKLQEVAPSLLSKDKRTKWLVRCTFSTAQKEGDDGSDGGGDKPQGGGSDFPEIAGGESKQQTMEVRFLTESGPAYAAQWESTGTIGASKDCPYIPEPSFKLGPTEKSLDEYVGIPLNSALAAIDPIPTRMIPASVIRTYTFNAFSYLEDVIIGKNAIGKINNAEHSIRAPGGQYTLKFPKDTLRLINAGVDAHDRDDDWAWYSMEYLYKPCGHYLVIPDVGTMVKNDFEPATLGTADGRYPFEIAVDPEHENIKDESGDPVAEPCRLDGRGKPITGASRNLTFALRYYEDKNIHLDFSDLPTF